MSLADHLRPTPLIELDPKSRAMRYLVLEDDLFDADVLRVHRQRK
jgi:hypothetical protein